MRVCSSMEHLLCFLSSFVYKYAKEHENCWADFHEISNWKIFQRIVKAFQFPFRLNNSNDHFT
jgi:hypothetical protein